MNRRESEQLLRAVREARSAGEPAALATVVAVKGSAYRREGTQMLVRRDRSFECALSGGCLEPAVADAAVRVIDTGVPALVRYDLADDSIWGLGIGCTGAVDIHIERVEDDEATNAWLAALERGDAAVEVLSLSGSTGRLVVRDAGVVGSLSDGKSTVGKAKSTLSEAESTLSEAESTFCEAAAPSAKPQLTSQAVARARERLRGRDAPSGAESIDGAELFFLVAAPPPHLVMFGAGHDAPPLARLAWSLGFAVTVVDVREAFLTADRFPGATLVSAHFSQFADAVRLTPESFALVMNHHVERDRESLRFCLASPARYIGVLGPRPRYEKMLAALAAAGSTFPGEALSRVRSPVGLALGAETPGEVAVAVLSEILAVGRGFDGGFLNGSICSLHRGDESSIFARS